MKQATTRRLEKLEDRAGINDKELAFIVQFIGVDKDGSPYTSGRIRIIPGQPCEELPALFFNEGDNHGTA